MHTMVIIIQLFFISIHYIPKSLCSNATCKSCCLFGANICNCPKLSVTGKRYKCPAEMNAADIFKPKLRVFVQNANDSIKDGLYTFVILHLDRVTKRGINVGIYVLAFNIKANCLTRRSCEIGANIRSPVIECTEKYDRYLFAFAFILRQKGELMESYFEARGYIVKASKFRHSVYFDGAPTHGTKIKLINCEMHSHLNKLKDIVEKKQGFAVMEEYLFNKYQRRPLDDQVKSLNLTYLTFDPEMVEYEMSLCTFRTEADNDEKWQPNLLYSDGTVCTKEKQDEVLKNFFSLPMEILLFRKDMWLLEAVNEHDLLYRIKNNSELLKRYSLRSKNLSQVEQRYGIHEAFARDFTTILYKVTRIIARATAYIDVIHNKPTENSSAYNEYT